MLEGREAYALPDDRLAVRFREEGPGKGYYAVMESGGGNRGPPGALGKFRVGLPDGGVHAPGSPRAAALEVSILSDEAGTSYVKQQSGRLIAAREVAPDMVDKLRSGDAATIQQIWARANSGQASVAELEELGNAVDVAGALRRRAGTDVAPLPELKVTLSIRKSQRLMASAREQRIVAARAGDMTWYAPPDYPAEAGLPPAVHPAGKPLAPGQSYVSRVIEESSVWSPPERIDFDGTAFGRRGPPGGGGGHGGKGTGAASAVGSPYRLLGSGVPEAAFVVVLPCRDGKERDRAGRPPCHEPPSREDREEREGMQRKFQAAIKTCDKDGDGRISSPVEEACVKAELKKVNMVLVPPEHR